MPNTEFDPVQIAQVATKQTEDMGQLRGEISALRGQVQATLQRSNSLATRSLDTVYTQWFQEVDKFIVDRTNLLSTTMTNTAGQQQAADEENSQAISSIAGFLR